MKDIRRIGLRLVAACGVTLVAAWIHAQEENDPWKPKIVDRGGGVRGYSAEDRLDDGTRLYIPPESRDSAFDRHFDLRLIDIAITNRDAALLTDLALQCADGERVLNRKHRSGITSAGLLNKAADLAIRQQDLATLERLARVAETTKNDELSGRLAAAKLGGATREADPALAVSDADIEVVTEIRDLLAAIDHAELVRDAELLDVIEQCVQGGTNLSQEQAAAIQKRVDAAQENLPADSEDPVAKLLGASRGWGLEDLDPTNKNSGVRKSLREFDNERLRHMSGSPRPGRDYTKVYARNSTQETIRVAIRYVPFEWSSGESTLKSVDDFDGPFDTHGWFVLKPGQRQHIANTANVVTYLYGESTSGKTWGGKYTKSLGSRSVPFRQYPILAPHREEVTINFK